MALSEDALRRHLLEGQVIPAHPLALDADRRLDERHQRALTRYYIDAGAGGVAVGVHTTQFAIRDPRHGLLAPVLELAARTVDEWLAPAPRPFVRIAGLCGPTAQAMSEARLARGYGYDAGLLSPGGWTGASERALLEHSRIVAEEIPLIGFYLQPAVGGRTLSYDFWRAFADIPRVVAIKVAPFDRYRTLDVLRAVADAGRAGEFALYTGNDDHIVLDLLTRLPSGRDERDARDGRTIGFAGGLLGQWAVWTRRAVELLAAVRSARAAAQIDRGLLARAAALTDANGAIFDVQNGFAGCIAGIHEVLRRQGLMAGTWCLREDETLSPGQLEAIDRVLAAYPDLNDDTFVAEHRDRWLE